MENQTPPARPQIPIWGWILFILAIVLAVQLISSGQIFSKSEKVTAAEVATFLENNSVEELTVTGNKVAVKLREQEEPLEWDKEPRLSVYEELEFQGVPSETLAGLNLLTPDGSTRATLFNIVLSLGPIILIIWIFSRGFRQIQGGGSNSIFGFGRSRAKNINEGDRPTVTFDDVAGVDEAKEEVEEVVQFLREPERFIQVGARIPKGVLMVGPPGTGKTLLARAIAGEAGVPFYHISGSEFVEMFVGVGASRVRDLFNKAKENAPAIVFVDEIDAVGRQRGAGMGGGHDEREQTLNQILTEMDGFDKETNVIVIAATNRADVLDPALLRPGRFDRKVLVDLPDIVGREAILKVHARGKPIGKDIEFRDWARLTAGFSGADLENLINEAAIFAARHNGTIIAMNDMQEAFDRIVIGPERKTRVMQEDEKEIVAYHEAGHAVAHHALPNADPVQKITIIPRGRAGGYVLSLPDDRTMKTQGWFEDRIAIALAGRAAEQTFFGQITSGASSDLQQATRLARMMVTQLGMSDELGLPVYGEEQGNPFLGGSFSSRGYSEEAAARIDNEVKTILEFQYGRIKGIIEENRKRIDTLVEKLMEVETLDRKEFEVIMNAEYA
ncbi:MAG TPA: ATP-dependent zinc metalloprotease FtsH [Anaerolineae bacterium]|nr:ATP-dependent zinc metalloprotease FtsH [Anaerolineae bacterium]